MKRFGSLVDVAVVTVIFGFSLFFSLRTHGSTTGTVTVQSALETEGMFTERDLTQEPDLSEAQYHTLADGEMIQITKAGVYVFSGSAKDTTILVEADDEDKVQLVLDGVEMVNEDFPCIYVKTGDKIFITTTKDSSLSVTGSFVKDGDINTDGAVFSKSDLTFSGTASLTISSTDNGIVGKDDVKFTGGTYQIEASSKTIEANDSIRIADGSFSLKAGTDCLHAENDKDDTLGYIYIQNGSFVIDAGDDGIHGTSVVQIDGGEFQISAAEGIEGTVIQLNDGTIYISSWDDGINAAMKSSSYVPSLEINGGKLTVVMNSGDTDGLDSNGNLTINGGVIDITAQSAVDYDGNGTYTGGTLIINGQQVTTLPNQMGGGRGGMGGWNQGGWDQDNGNRGNGGQGKGGRWR